MQGLEKKDGWKKNAENIRTNRQQKHGDACQLRKHRNKVLRATAILLTMKKLEQWQKSRKSRKNPPMAF